MLTILTNFNSNLNFTTFKIRLAQIFTNVPQNYIKTNLIFYAYIIPKS